MTDFVFCANLISLIYCQQILN